MNAEEQALLAALGVGAAARPGVVVGPPAAAPPGGPGTELRLLLASLGLRGEEGCGCKALAVEMDRLGVAGCERERDRILARLRDAQAKLGWAATLGAALRAAAGLAWRPDPRRIPESLLEEALRRAAAPAPPP